MRWGKKITQVEVTVGISAERGTSPKLLVSTKFFVLPWLLLGGVPPLSDREVGTPGLKIFSCFFLTRPK